MAVHDVIGDFLTTLRNASKAQKEEVIVFHSKVKEGILRILKDEGYIADYEVTDTDSKIKKLKISMRYVDGTPSLTDIQRVSKPGRRTYSKSDEVPQVLGGIGFSILTTPKGILNDREARREKVGGEVLCSVW